MAKWLNKTNLAKALDLSRPTLTGYLARKGAPRPNKARKYELEVCRKWAEKCASESAGPRTAVVAGSELSKLRERRLALEVEEAERRAKVAAGQLVHVDEIGPAISGMMAGLTADLISKFRDELPSKYKGRSVAECQEMNEAGIEWVLTRLRAAGRRVSA